MPTPSVRILGVHGLGDHRTGAWIPKWRDALIEALPDVQVEFYDASYDHIMEQTSINPIEFAGAVLKLLGSGLSSLGRRERLTRGFGDRLHFTAGYVCAWVEDDGFQRRTRRFILDRVREVRPDVILAHSLGSLVTFNAFSHPDAEEPVVAEILRNARYVTIGSQIGNPFVVRNLTTGRIEPLDVEFWHHVYNRHDDVFTAKIDIPLATNFKQTRSDFDTEDDHSAITYIGWRNTRDEVWRPISERARGVRALAPMVRSSVRRTVTARRDARRALLIGINDYPNPSDRLEGCVNDVFQMSAVLQECGFAPEAIRTCLNERATCEGILSRLEWLVDDARPGDERVFYYSGHGAHIPEYGANGEPDHHTEALVPYDFDWSPERAITDDRIYDLYSQLPYDLRLIMIFDCCHSGSMHRDGGAKARGLTPPDDIRHRELKWDRQAEMWVPRDFERINRSFSPKANVNAKFFGEDGATVKLGRASMLRNLSAGAYKRAQAARKQDKRVGPYLPLIIEACGENQFSYEYRHGVTSYGAFTYSLTQILRRRRNISFEELVAETGKQLKELEYRQDPQILGPTAIQSAKVPWLTAPTPRARRTVKKTAARKARKTAKTKRAKKKSSE